MKKTKDISRKDAKDAKKDKRHFVFLCALCAFARNAFAFGLIDEQA
jgi:hypothetical protein